MMNKLRLLALVTIGWMVIIWSGQLHHLADVTQRAPLLIEQPKRVYVTRRNADRYLMYHHRAECIREDVFGERYVGWIAAQADSSKAPIYFQCLYEPTERSSHVERRITKG